MPVLVSLGKQGVGSCCDRLRDGAAANQIVNACSENHSDIAEGAQVRFGLVRFPSSNRLLCRLKRSEEHTSELQSHLNLVCRLLLEKKNAEPPWEDSILQIDPRPRHATTRAHYPCRMCTLD